MMSVDARQCSESQRAVLVTGASGFIGSQVVRRMLEDGISVIALVQTAETDRAKRLASMQPVHGRELAGGLQVLAYDLHHGQAVSKLILQTRPSACIHAAWDVRKSGYRDDAVNQRWVKSSLHLFDALRRNGCNWVGVLGTCVEPGDGQRPVDRYAAAKSTLRHRMFELALAGRNGAAPMNVCWWKLFQPYGPAEPNHRFVPSMIDALRRRQSFVVRNPNDVRDFIHVDDVASGIVKSYASRLSGVFELGTGIGHRIADVAEFVAEQFHSRDCLQLHPTARDDSSSLIADITSLTNAISWKPQRDLHTSFNELMRESAEDLKVAA
jgi:nucleoside-diphosphate-sugar epimerase